MVIFEEIAQSVIEGDAGKVADQVRKALDGGVEPLEMINNGLVKGMGTVGEKFKTGEMFLPEVIFSGDALYAGVDLVKPLLADGAMPSKGTAVIGTIKGDLHDIGKNLVGMMLESSGYKVVNLGGADVSPEAYIQAAREHDAEIIGCSAMLTTTMVLIADVVKLLETEGLKGKVRVMVGGAPVSPEFSDKIGADGYAPDATTAVELANELF